MNSTDQINHVPQGNPGKDSPLLELSAVRLQVFDGGKLYSFTYKTICCYLEGLFLNLGILGFANPGMRFIEHAKSLFDSCYSHSVFQSILSSFCEDITVSELYIDLLVNETFLNFFKALLPVKSFYWLENKLPQCMNDKPKHYDSLKLFNVFGASAPNNYMEQCRASNGCNKFVKFSFAFLQMKTFLPELGVLSALASLRKHGSTLSTATPLREIAVDSPIKASILIHVEPNEILSFVRDIVKTLFANVKKERTVDFEQLIDIAKPTFGGTFRTSRGQGGARHEYIQRLKQPIYDEELTEIEETLVIDRDLKDEDDWVEILVANKVRQFDDDPLEYQIESFIETLDVEDDWVNIVKLDVGRPDISTETTIRSTRLRTKLSGIENDISIDGVTIGPPIKSRVALVLDPLKIRVITAIDSDEKILLYFKNKINDRLRKLSFFTLCFSSIDQWRETLGLQLGDGTSFLSGDYSAATDGINRQLSVAILDEIFNSFGVKNDFGSDGHKIRKFAMSTLVRNFISYPTKKIPVIQHFLKEMKHYGMEVDFEIDDFEQQNGQLMGSLLSFPILSIANLAMGLFALQKRFPNENVISKISQIVKHDLKIVRPDIPTLGEVRKYHLELNDRSYLISEDFTKHRAKWFQVFIHGDDYLGLTDPKHFIIWKQLCSSVGLHPSPGKNWVSNKFFTVDSKLFVYNLKESVWSWSRHPQLSLLNPSDTMGTKAQYFGVGKALALMHNDFCDSMYDRELGSRTFLGKWRRLLQLLPFPFFGPIYGAKVVISQVHTKLSSLQKKAISYVFPEIGESLSEIHIRTKPFPQFDIKPTLEINNVAMMSERQEVLKDLKEQLKLPNRLVIYGKYRYLLNEVSDDIITSGLLAGFLDPFDLPPTLDLPIVIEEEKTVEDFIYEKLTSRIDDYLKRGFTYNIIPFYSTQREFESLLFELRNKWKSAMKDEKYQQLGKIDFVLWQNSILAPKMLTLDPNIERDLLNYHADIRNLFK